MSGPFSRTKGHPSKEVKLPFEIEKTITVNENIFNSINPTIRYLTQMLYLYSILFVTI